MCIPSFRFVTPRVFWTIPSLFFCVAFSRYHGNHFPDFFFAHFLKVGSKSIIMPSFRFVAPRVSD